MKNMNFLRRNAKKNFKYSAAFTQEQPCDMLTKTNLSSAEKGKAEKESWR